MDRRSFLRLCAASSLGHATIGARNVFSGSPGTANASTSVTLKALAFDGFPIFDPRPVVQAVSKAVGTAFVDVWRERLFSYQWLRALGGQYRDFLEVSDEALAFAAARAQVDLPDESIKSVRTALLSLQAWDDVRPGLLALKARGLKLALLSNMTPSMLQNGVANSGLGRLIDLQISTDAVHSYKPSPDAYLLAEQMLGVDRSHIGFVAFAGWDAAGASWFGYPTFWMNRLRAQPERLAGGAPHAIGKNMSDLITFVDAWSSLKK